MGLPLAGGALTLVVPHPIIARHTWRKTGQQGCGINEAGSVELIPEPPLVSSRPGRCGSLAAEAPARASYGSASAMTW